MTAPLVVLVGATGSGKTAAALELAAQLPIEVISMDSVQVYRGMDIGSAKPTADERRRLTHHVVDVVDPDVAFSAADWLRHAERAIADVRSRHRIPLVVGGTGLYLRALRDGLAELPSAEVALRAELERCEDENPGSLHARLVAADPESAARIQPRDRVRIIRALEVHRLTGRPLSAWLREHAANRADRPLLHVVVDPPRAALEEGLSRRAEHMIATGLVTEAQALRARFGAVRPLSAVGYKEALAFTDGAITRAELVPRIVQATRQFARRQRTWWKKIEGARVVPDVAGAAAVLRDAITTTR